MAFSDIDSNRKTCKKPKLNIEFPRLNQIIFGARSAENYGPIL